MTTIILLPGMDGTGDLLADFVSALGKDVQAIVIAYPEHQPLDYRALADFARMHLPIDRPYVLLGESFSGPVAISLAASRPPGLIGLVLCCTFARNPVPWLGWLKGMIALLPVSSKLVGLVSPLLLGRDASPELRADLRRALDKVPAATLRVRMRAVLEVDYSEQLKDISVPILYLQATEDGVVPSSAAQLVARSMPAAKIVSLSGPHLLLQSMPEQVVEIVFEFMCQAALNATVPAAP